MRIEEAATHEREGTMTTTGTTGGGTEADRPLPFAGADFEILN